MSGRSKKLKFDWRGPAMRRNLAELAGELGISHRRRKRSGRRLGQLKTGDDARGISWRTLPGKLIGWIHVSRNYLLESAVRAEIMDWSCPAAARSQGCRKGPAAGGGRVGAQAEVHRR